MIESSVALMPYMFILIAKNLLMVTFLFGYIKGNYNRNKPIRSLFETITTEALCVTLDNASKDSSMLSHG